jgi:hypothetical protein
MGDHGASRALRKQAPKTKRASETRALRARRNRDRLVARAADRSAAKAGQVRAIWSGSRSKARTERREKIMTGSVGSPLVATGSVEGSVITAEASSAGRRSGQRGEANSKNSDRSPPVVSGSKWGEGMMMAAHGSPPVASAAGGLASQKLTARPLAMSERGRVGAKARHSARQAGVRTSPFQQPGARVPAAVQPGHLLWVAKMRMGHSNGR